MWQALAQDLLRAGYQLRVPAGNAAELSRARRIAASSDKAALVLDALPLGELMAVFRQADLVVGVDSGLTHLAGALGLPTVVMTTELSRSMDEKQNTASVGAPAGAPTCPT